MGHCRRHGAARIRDVLFDHAIHGVPETVVVGKDTRIERRRFNHRTMIWALQHHLPDDYPGGGKLPAGPKRKAWEKELPSIEAVQAEILKKVDALHRHKIRHIATDPAKRAAWELVHPGDRYDWNAIAAGAPLESWRYGPEEPDEVYDWDENGPLDRGPDAGD